jgi:hypothetical protein
MVTCNDALEEAEMCLDPEGMLYVSHLSLP